MQGLADQRLSVKANEIAEFIDSMFDDELDFLSQLLSLSEPEKADVMLLRENGRPDCPECKVAMRKNGTDGNGHQKWI